MTYLMKNKENIVKKAHDAYFRYALGKEPTFETDRKALAAAIRSIAVEADWEAEDPKFMMLDVADMMEAGFS
jgi:hypothetical protein